MFTLFALLCLNASDWNTRNVTENWCRAFAPRETVSQMMRSSPEQEHRTALYRVFRAVTIRDLDSTAARNGGYFNALGTYRVEWLGHYEDDSPRYPEFRCLPPGIWLPDESDCDGKWYAPTEDEHRQNTRRALIHYTIRTGDLILPYYLLENRAWPPLLPKP